MEVWCVTAVLNTQIEVLGYSPPPCLDYLISLYNLYVVCMYACQIKKYRMIEYCRYKKCNWPRELEEKLSRMW